MSRRSGWIGVVLSSLVAAGGVTSAAPAVASGHAGHPATLAALTSSRPFHPVVRSLPRSPAVVRVAPRRFAAAALLPVSVDLTANTLSPGNQGAVGSCTTWAVGYSLLGYYSKTQPHAGAPFAPMFIYSQINGGRDAGSSISAALSLVVSQGVAERSVYTQGDVDWRTQPTAAERANAALHKVASYSTLFSKWSTPSADDVTAVKAALATGHPVVIAIPVYDSFEWPAAGAVIHAPGSSERLWGYHAITAFGYNTTGLVIENSWGTGWGRHGFATLAWDFVNRYLMEASDVTGFVTSGGPPPVIGSVSTRLARVAGGGTLKITGSNLSKASTISFTSVAQPGTVATGSILSATASTLTVAIPAVPAPGDYALTVSTASGQSATAGPKVTFLADPVPTRATGVLRAGAGGTVTLSGTGFGATAQQFAVLKPSVQVGVAGSGTLPVTVPVKYLGDTAVSLTVRGTGRPGQRLTVTLLNPDGATLYSDSSLVFQASLDSATATTDRSKRVTVKVRGVGLAGSSTWTLGSTVLRVASSSDALSRLGSGAYVESDVVAYVKVPLPMPTGTYPIQFVPDAQTYPGVTGPALSVVSVVYAASRTPALRR